MHDPGHNARPGNQERRADDPDELSGELTVVRPGARTRFTARIFLRIIRRIETGWSVSQACRAEGFTYRRFRQLCQTRPNYQARYQRAERECADFRRDRCEHIVQLAATQSWQAAAWWLERTNPDNQIFCKGCRVLGGEFDFRRFAGGCTDCNPLTSGKSRRKHFRVVSSRVSVFSIFSTCTPSGVR